MATDAMLPQVFTRAQALDAGVTRHQADHRVRSRRWRVLGRGVYAVSKRFELLSPREQLLARSVAATLIREEGCTVSHVCAAAVHGWPLPLHLPQRAWVTRQPAGRSARHQPLAVVEVAGMADDEVGYRTIRLGESSWSVPVTSPRRTLADCLRHLDVEEGVAMADAVLRCGHVERSGLASMLMRQATWPYFARAERATALLDPRRESWLESVSAVTLAALGGPVPEPQVIVLDAEGAFVARVDGWVDPAVVVEMDGRGKLWPTDPDQRSNPAAVALSVRRGMERQHARELRLRALGVEVVRWGIDEVLRHPRRVVERLRRAVRASTGRQFTGALVRGT